MNKTYRIIFADLDGTLINPISGSTFPKGAWDMSLRFEVLDKIKEMSPAAILIATNQGGISRGFLDERNFLTKLEYVKLAISEYVECPVYSSYCISTNSSHFYRKPNIGMLKLLYNKCYGSIFKDKVIPLDQCVMIGDASGKEGQFSDSDKKCAENFGIDYIDVEDFIK